MKSVLRFSPIALSLACFGALGVALCYQLLGGHAPCALCIVQRYCYLIVGLSLMPLLVGPVGPVRPWIWLATVFALSGLAVSLEHLWVLAHPMVGCGRDPLELYLNHRPWVAYAPSFFTASGLCTDKLPPLLGLTMPQWSAAGFAALSIILPALAFTRGVTRGWR